MVGSYTESRPECWRSALRAAYNCSTDVKFTFLQTFSHARRKHLSTSLPMYVFSVEMVYSVHTQGVTLIEQMLRVTRWDSRAILYRKGSARIWTR